MQDRIGSRQGRGSAVAVALAALIAALLWGCETIQSTTIEENRGAYQDARAFLQVGRTTKADATRKYGAARETRALDDGGEYWLYRKTETVVMNAYSGTPLGTEGSIIRDLGGYQHTIDRTTTLELFFDRDGVLAHYRINRGTL